VVCAPMKHLTEGAPTEWRSKAPASPTPRTSPSRAAPARRTRPGERKRGRDLRGETCGLRATGAAREAALQMRARRTGGDGGDHACVTCGGSARLRRRSGAVSRQRAARSGVRGQRRRRTVQRARRSGGTAPTRGAAGAAQRGAAPTERRAARGRAGALQTASCGAMARMVGALAAHARQCCSSETRVRRRLGAAASQWAN